MILGRWIPSHMELAAGDRIPGIAPEGVVPEPEGVVWMLEGASGHGRTMENGRGELKERAAELQPEAVSLGCRPLEG
jgi:hypothetical protein